MPTWCVRFGFQCAALTSASSLSARSDFRTLPSSSYSISLPGCFRSSSWTVGGKAYGGPPDFGGLCVGNSRQMSTPPGASNCAMRRAHCGRILGCNAQRNCSFVSKSWRMGHGWCMSDLLYYRILHRIPPSTLQYLGTSHP